MAADARDRTRARDLVERLAATSPRDLPRTLEELAPYRARVRADLLARANAPLPADAAPAKRRERTRHWFPLANEPDALAPRRDVPQRRLTGFDRGQSLTVG